MKTQIFLKYKKEIYTSDECELNDDELLKLQFFLEKAAKGELESFVIKNGVNTFYFSKNIILKSIITLKVKEE